MTTATDEFVHVKFEISDGDIFVYASKNSPPLKIIVLDTREYKEPHSTVFVIPDSNSKHNKMEKYESDNKTVDENVDYEHSCCAFFEIDTSTHYETTDSDDSTTNSDN